MGEKYNKISKMFPDYFDRFEMPEGAGEECIIVYRACRSGRCDSLSFIPTFEQQGFKYNEKQDPKDPGVYSLSTFEEPKHIKRWAALTSDMNVPYKIAKGVTNPIYGVCQRTKERKSKSKSHVDWWLYQGATPYKDFKLIENFEEYIEEYYREK